MNRSTRARRFVGALSGGVAILLLGRHALAQESTRVAEDFFKAGTAAYRRGDYSAAAREFEEAARRAPHAATSYNAGVAWQLAGDPLRAANALRLALESPGLPKDLEEDARTRHAELAPQFGEVSISGPTDALVEVPGLARDHPPLRTYAVPGTLRISIEYASGRRDERNIGVERARTVQLAFADEPRKAPPLPSPSSSSSSRTVTGIALLGAGGISAGAGIVLGVRGLAARNRFDDSGHTDADARDEALSLRNYANVAFAGALVLSTIGTVILVVKPTSSTQAAFFTVGPGFVGLGQRF
jgi:tetratricopeptide (TPR) repeat protein